MADDVTVDPPLRKKLKEIHVEMPDELSSLLASSSKVKEPMGLRAPQKEMSGSSQVKELTERNLRGQSPIQFKLPSELNDALSDTQRLHVFDYLGWWHYHDYKRHGNTFRHRKPKHNADVSFIRYGNEYHEPISWNIDDDGAWIRFEDGLPLCLPELISALAPLCQKVEHIAIGSDEDPFFLRDRSQPVIPMRSVLSVYLLSWFAPLHDSLHTVSRCFPNAKSLVLVRERASPFESTSRHHSGISLPSLRRFEIRMGHNLDTLGNLFLLLFSYCQNIESLTVTSDRILIWEKPSTAIRECKLPNLTDIHLELRGHEEHYALQMITNLLRECRVMSSSLEFVKVGSVLLGDVVIRSAVWSRTSSDCWLHIKGASAAVPITDLIDLTTRELKEVKVLALVSCKNDFGQSQSKSLQSPKELGTLREIRFVGSENPLSESDRNKLSELYPNVKVTENQTSQESSVESQEGAGIPSKLDKASSRSLKTSAIDELVEEKVEFHEDTGSQNPGGGEEETSWREKEEEFDVNQGGLPHESGSVGVE